MIILYLLIIPIVCIFIRIILCLIVYRYGRFSYDGFSAVGFAYNAEKDIFYSTKNAWQKNFGYTHMYDVMAPIFRMIVDTEPVRFHYNNKNWLITFWKGQYGMVTGAEIGIYCTDKKKVSKKTVYFPVSEDEMLNMDLVLYKNDKLISKVHCKHWWLAVFKLGMFSKPKELSMDINITFPNRKMLDAFLQSFKKLGYKPKDYKVMGNTFCFTFKKPKTRKVWTRSWLFDLIRQFFNRYNVKLYDKYTEGLIDENKKDDKRIGNKNLIMVNELIPDLLKNADNNSNVEQIIKTNNIEKNVILLDKCVYPGNDLELL